MPLTELGKTIRKYRIDNNMLLMDMCKEIGVRPAYMSGVETGRHKPNEKVKEYLKTIGIHVQEEEK